MFDPGIHLDIPAGDLLAEIGLDPHAVSEVIADDRGTRSPDRDQVLPDRGRSTDARPGGALSQRGE